MEELEELEETPTPESGKQPAGKLTTAQKIKQHEKWLMDKVKSSNQLDERLFQAQETLKKLQSENKGKKDKLLKEQNELKIKLYNLEHSDNE